MDYEKNRFIFHAICIIVAITCIFPLIWMVSSSLKTQQTVFSDMSVMPSNPQWKNYYIAWLKAGFGGYFFNSLFYTVIVVSLVIIISSLSAYGISKLSFPGKNFIFLLLISTMMIPLPGAFIALYTLLTKLGLVNTRIGYILCLTNSGLPLAIFLLKTFFDKIPTELEDAAEIDGCNKLQKYLYLALPLAKPSIMVIAIFNVLNVWNEYLLAMLIFSDKHLMPLQRGLMIFYGAHITEYPLLMAGLTITTIPVIIIYFLLQRHIISGIIAGALKG